MAAGPLMVILTDVTGSQRSKPEYNFFASSKQHMDTPAFPIFPKISGLRPGSLPYSVTESKAVESLLGRHSQAYVMKSSVGSFRSAFPSKHPGGVLSRSFKRIQTQRYTGILQVHFPVGSIAINRPTPYTWEVLLLEFFDAKEIRYAFLS